MANRDFDPRLQKTNHSGYFVNQDGFIVNDDELAWMKYKAEREKTKALMDLIQTVRQLNIRVTELEKQING
jgi:hypothetical protein